MINTVWSFGKQPSVSVPPLSCISSWKLLLNGRHKTEHPVEVKPEMLCAAPALGYSALKGICSQGCFGETANT